MENYQDDKAITWSNNMFYWVQLSPYCSLLRSYMEEKSRQTATHLVGSAPRYLPLKMTFLLSLVNIQSTTITFAQQELNGVKHLWETCSLSSPNKLKLEFTIPHLYDIWNQHVYDLIFSISMKTNLRNMRPSHVNKEQTTKIMRRLLIQFIQYLEHTCEITRAFTCKHNFQLLKTFFHLSQRRERIWALLSKFSVSGAGWLQ